MRFKKEYTPSSHEKYHASMSCAECFLEELDKEIGEVKLELGKLEFGNVKQIELRDLLRNRMDNKELCENFLGGVTNA